MLDTPLKMHRSRKGPSVTVQVYAHEGKITQIALYPHQETGIYWQMVADHSYPELESKLDEWIYAYCDGAKKAPSLPLNFEGVSSFTDHVLEIIKRIPFGQTLTYQEVAKKVGNPKAARAVGSACGRNPFALIIPCHRVLAAGNRLGGFSLDLAVKRRLLAFEGITEFPG